MVCRSASFCSSSVDNHLYQILYETKWMDLKILSWPTQWSTHGKSCRELSFCRSKGWVFLGDNSPCLLCFCIACEQRHWPALGLAYHFKDACRANSLGKYIQCCPPEQRASFSILKAAFSSRTGDRHAYGPLQKTCPLNSEFPIIQPSAWPGIHLGTCACPWDTGQGEWMRICWRSGCLWSCE